jgi:hypothetical protein
VSGGAVRVSDRVGVWVAVIVGSAYS